MAFAETLVALAEQDNRIVAVCNDSVGSSNLKKFRERYPDRLINVGIAEQNLVGVSAGLAAADDTRLAEVLDLAGVARDHLADIVAAALTVPVATDWHAVTFGTDSYWRGETHRLGDRPGALLRLLHELVVVDVEQVILVSSAPASADVHELVPSRLDGRGRFGEQVQAAEAAALQDVLLGRPAGLRLFIIRPEHNPIGPFDFAGAFDDRSDRPSPLAEVMSLGYEDAFRQFVEPIVAPSGDRVGMRR